MSLSCSLALCFNSPLSPFPISKTSQHSLSRPFICFSLSSSSSNSNYEREESRWLREEQRWLREEQRWLDERESLLRQVAALNLRIQELERRSSEIQGGPLNQIAESGSIAVPMVAVEAVAVEESGGKVAEEVVVVKEVVREGKKRTTLRKGSEGDDVRAMQATLGAREDGIMTAELQERLYMEQQMGGSGLAVNTDPKGNETAPKVGVNGAAFASITEISEIQKTVVEEEGITEVDVSEHRVFLLGENRWEKPSSLTVGNKHGGGAKSKNSTTKCLSCRGEGRVLCMECDGTGEPNIEPQFMEWVDEGTKCPYCEGLGYTICDVCEGKALV
ncbi:protein disulfide isomerase pTAC5, chloroplastic-like isoform X2 [Actinidia eriantha]|uniref:protein disulfide isomerase pTAC5, chloroplastic-like isoform X2 n=1 Tax=Actinidia eriantha TaxID=165200 RepID=UPI00258F7B81|nr:protein disulfide isomerase pTAC5, chloroplastic-like isoform X2 [Actinidia eriantha]